MALAESKNSCMNASICSNPATKTKQTNIKVDKEKNVQVFVRVRPLNNAEKMGKSFTSVSCQNGKEIIVKERPNEKHQKTFQFDKTFGPDSKQIDVYKMVVHPLIGEVLAGYNCTVFAYGQTGTGKTFTMEGEKSHEVDVSWEDDPLSGIIPRALSHLFDELTALQVEHTVRVSFLELYNEEIFDLLSPTDDTSKLRLFEDSMRKGSVIIQNLEEITVNDKQEVYKILERGSLKRTTAATLMNAQSSRSHTVFSITVHIKDNSVNGEELLKTGKLNLVDLAGSENIGRSGAVEKRAREAGNINQSLLTLGRCITSLVEKAPHVPYRESKLTRLLQDSLGGRTKTSIIATISPASINYEETLSTLDYAHRAKNITNKPEINQKLTKTALLRQYTEEIQKLKRDLEAARDKNGIFIDPDNYSEMMVQFEEMKNRVATIVVMKDEMAKKEELLSKLNMKWDRARDAFERTMAENEEKEFLIKRHEEVKQKMAAHSKELKEIAEQKAADAEKLHRKLDVKRILEEENFRATNEMVANFENTQSTLLAMLSNCQSKQDSFFNRQLELIGDNLSKQIELESVRNSISAVYGIFAQLVEDNDRAREKLFVADVTARDYFQKLEDFYKLNAVHSARFIDELNRNFKRILEWMDTAVACQNDMEKRTEGNRVAGEELLRTYSLLNSCMFEKIEEIKEMTRNLSTLRETTIKTQQEAHANRAFKKAAFLDKMKEMITLYEEDKEDGHHTLILEQLGLEMKGLKDIQSAADRAYSMLDEQGKCVDDVYQGMTATANQIQTSVHTAIESLDSVQKFSKVYNEELVARTENEIEKGELFYRDSANYFQTVHETLLADYEQEKKATLEAVGKMETRVEEVSDKLKAYDNRVKEFLKDSRKAFETHQVEIGEQVVQTVELLYDQTEALHRYVNQELKQDFSTGQTPQRRGDVQWPIVDAMSPYETILTRFRKEYNNKHKIPVFDESEVESGTEGD